MYEVYFQSQRVHRSKKTTKTMRYSTKK